jgi:hypothetical protein
MMSFTLWLPLDHLNSLTFLCFSAGAPKPPNPSGEGSASTTSSHGYSEPE